jgi:chromosome segregation ATPase
MNAAQVVRAFEREIQQLQLELKGLRDAHDAARVQAVLGQKEPPRQPKRIAEVEARLEDLALALPAAQEKVRAEAAAAENAARQRHDQELAEVLKSRDELTAGAVAQLKTALSSLAIVDYDLAADIATYAGRHLSGLQPRIRSNTEGYPQSLVLQLPQGLGGRRSRWDGIQAAGLGGTDASAIRKTYLGNLYEKKGV